MITSGEIGFIRELINELCTLSDPSEYYEGEVRDALDLLNKLEEYNTQQVMYMIKQMNEMENNPNGIIR